MFAQFARWFSPASDVTRAHALYIALVGQARQPFFYEKLGVPDTLDGRFDMILLHLSLYVERMKNEDASYQPLTGMLLETFVQDMDRSLREMGIGDTGVAKRVKKMANALNGRLSIYAGCDNAETLKEALRRNVYGTIDEVSDDLLNQLTDYVTRAQASLAAQAPADLASASFRFPTE